MQNRTLLFATAALSSACLLSTFAGCSSSSSPNSPDSGGTQEDSSTPVDSGSPTGDSSTPSETGAGDTGTTPTNDGSTEAGPTLDCTGGVAPQGTKLLASTTQTVQGVTSDGQIILYDTSAKSLSAMSLASPGTPTMINAYDSTGLGVSGKVLYYFGGMSTATPAIDGLSVWTAAGGNVSLSSAAWDIDGSVAISSDSNWIAYTKNATATKADIWVAGTDGSNAQALVTGARYDTYCNIELQFVGSALVVSSCAGGDGGPLQATITAYSGTGWGTTQTFSSAAFYGYSSDKAGTMLAFVTAGGQYVQALGTNTTPTLIDANGLGAAVFSPDDSTLYYIECSGASCTTSTPVTQLYKSSITTPAPTAVSSTTFEGNYGVSPDGNWIEAYKGANAAGTFTDLYISSTAAGSTPVALVSTTTAAFFSDQWTIDGTQALFFGNVVLSGQGYIGDFEHAPLTAPITPATIAHNVWQGNATSGAKVLYNDNYVSGGPLYGYADIESLDLGASGATPTKLVTAADANYFITADKSTILYSFSACPSLGTPGVYSLAAP